METSSHLTPSHPIQIGGGADPGAVELRVLAGILSGIVARWALATEEAGPLLAMSFDHAEALVDGTREPDVWSRETETRIRIVIQIDKALAALIADPEIVAMWLRHARSRLDDLPPLAVMGSSLERMRWLRRELDGEVANLDGAPLNRAVG